MRMKQAMRAAEACQAVLRIRRLPPRFRCRGPLGEPGRVVVGQGAEGDVQDEVTKLEETEEAKSWMALGSRDKSALLTYPQLLRIIDHAWKDGFSDLVRDKALVQEARLIGHLRNTICHMTPIPDEETERVKQTMRDWFRVVAP